MVDIYDLSNFNIKKEPEHIIEIKRINGIIVVKRNNVEQIYDRFVPLMDMDVGIKTIKIVSTNETCQNNSSGCRYIILRKKLYEQDIYLYLNRFININPAFYYIDKHVEFNYIIYIYEYDPKYDINFNINYLRDKSTYMPNINKIDIIYRDGLHYFAFVYMIDVYNYYDNNSNIGIYTKGKYLSDIVNRNNKAIIYMKIFKINNNSVRIYIERIKLFNKVIQLCKFNGNQFIKFHNIEFNPYETIQIIDFPCGLQLDINNSEIVTHMVKLELKTI
jgi:hypothetical protein